MSEIDKHISTSILDIEGLRNDLMVMCLLTKLRETVVNDVDTVRFKLLEEVISQLNFFERLLY